jgi:hypothetical protein
MLISLLISSLNCFTAIRTLVLAIFRLTWAAFLYFKQQISGFIKSMTGPYNLKGFVVQKCTTIKGLYSPLC